MKITYSQIQRIHGLLPAHIKNDKEAKGDLVQQFTNDPARRSTAQLSHLEAVSLIESIGGNTNPKNNNDWLKFDYKNAQHRKILSLCMQNNWQKIYKGKVIADLVPLAKWLQGAKSPVKKPIVKMSPTELSKIIVALDNIASHTWQQQCKSK